MLPVNDNSKPLILIGSNSKMFFLQDMCDELNITIAGIIDNDYYGNTKEINGIPVIDTELNFNDPDQLEYYKNNYNFFLAVNWHPYADPVIKRNRQKRKYLMDLLDQLDLPCINLVHKTARIQKTTVLGKNVLVDAYVNISAENVVEDYVSFFSYAIVGANNTIKRNSVFQRKTGLMHNTVVEQDVYFDLNVNVFVSNVTFGHSTVIQPCLSLGRGTSVGEMVSLVGKDLRRVYQVPTVG